MKNSLKYAFLEFVNRHQLILPGQKVLAAVSGGVDSLVLLHLLQTWQPYFNLAIGVGHFNHRLRGKAAAVDERFVRSICERAGIPFFRGSGEVKAYARQHKFSIEEAARKLREAFLENCRREQGYDAIATGHNLNDQAETLLMRLLTGAGPEGLAGIRLRREGFIRPLLFAERAEIEAYAAAHHIDFREDRSNRDVRIRRNKIRRKLIPYLQREFHLADLKPFLNLALTMQEWLPQLYQQVERLWKEAVKVESENKIRLGITIYSGYFSQIQIRILERILAQLAGAEKRLTFNQFADFSGWIREGKESSRFLLPGNIAVNRAEGQLIFEPAANLKKIEVQQDIFPGQSYENRELGVSLRASLGEKKRVRWGKHPGVEYLDADRLNFPLRLRNWRPGDRFQPLGMAHPKKLSDFLTDEPGLFLPRERMLVLENRGEIVWVVGSRISEKYKITEATGKVLKLEVKKL